MRYLYQRHWTETITAGHSKRVYSDLVKPGWLLEVHYCYLHLPDSKSGHVATIYIETGGEDLVLRSRARDAAKQGMSAIRPFHIGEHRRVYGHAPDANTNDTISLSLCGAMLQLKKWRKGKV